MEENENNNLNLSANNASFGFFVGFLLCQLAVIIALMIAQTVGTFFGITNESVELFFNNCYGYFILTLITDSVLLAIFIFGSKGKNNKVFSKPKFTKILIYFLLSVMIYFVLTPIIICLDTLFVKLGLNLSEIPYSITGKSLPISILSLAILPAICEELLFRGFIQKSLQKYGRVLSIVLTTLMFAIFHMSLEQLLYPILFGLFLSVIMDKENNILYCIIAHATNNLISLFTVLFDINLAFNNIAFIIIAIALALIYLASLLVFVMKTKKPESASKFTKREKIYLMLSFVMMIIIWTLFNFST